MHLKQSVTKANKGHRKEGGRGELRVAYFRGNVEDFIPCTYYSRLARMLIFARSRPSGGGGGEKVNYAPAIKAVQIKFSSSAFGLGLPQILCFEFFRAEGTSRFCFKKRFEVPGHGDADRCEQEMGLSLEYSSSS